MKEAGFPHVGDDEPVDVQIEGVLQGSFDGRALAAAERPVKQIAGTPAAEDAATLKRFAFPLGSERVVPAARGR